MSESVRINKKTKRQAERISKNQGVTTTGAISMAIDVYSHIVDAHFKGASIILEGKDGERTRILI